MDPTIYLYVNDYPVGTATVYGIWEDDDGVHLEEDKIQSLLEAMDCRRGTLDVWYPAGDLCFHMYRGEPPIFETLAKFLEMNNGP